MDRMDSPLYCAACDAIHPIVAVAAGLVRPPSDACRAAELGALIESATDIVEMAARSGVWGIAEEALDVVLGLNDAGSDVP
jgi:hypothetical protein